MPQQTDHYIFYYEKGSTAEKEIIDIGNNQEICVEHILSFLNVKLERPINYHLFETAQEVGKAYSLIFNEEYEPINGFAMSKEESKDNQDHIYAVYNQDIKCTGFHEDAHIVSYYINIPPQVFIREGLAMFFDVTYWGIDNTSWCYYFLKKNKLPNIEKLFDNDYFYEYSDVITYPIAGAFTQYLVHRFGKDKYLEFYGELSENYNECILKVFDLELKDICNDFIKWLSQMSVDDKVIEIMDELNR